MSTNIRKRFYEVHFFKFESGNDYFTKNGSGSARLPDRRVYAPGLGYAHSCTLL